MGVYSQYAAFEGGSSVVANESYVGAAGAYRMMEESSMNEHAIFEAIIGRDFAEAYCALSEGTVVSENTLDYLNEASLGGIWQKVVEFIQKVWEKIKGILKSIKDRIQSVFIRDGKALVDKYHKQIQKKMTDGMLSKFKFKWRAFTANATGKDSIAKDVFVGVVNSSTVGTDLNADLTMARDNKSAHSQFKTSGYLDRSDKIAKPIAQTTNNDDRREAIRKVNSTDETDSYKDIRPYTSDEITKKKEDLLGKLVPGNTGDVSVSDFAKEYEDAIFDSVEELEYGKFDEMFNEIENNLKEGKKFKDTIDKEERAVDRWMKEKRRYAENIQKEMSKLAGKDTDTVAAAAANRTASRAISCLNIIQECSSKYYAAVLSCTKIYLKQARAAYIKAATWNQKKAFEENAIFCEAVEDVSNYEVEEMFSCM